MRAALARRPGIGPQAKGPIRAPERRGAATIHAGTAGVGAAWWMVPGSGAPVVPRQGELPAQGQLPAKRSADEQAQDHDDDQDGGR